eukprot:scaffold83625_cov15-Tisochrysis_lutea.AAC.1
MCKDGRVKCCLLLAGQANNVGPLHPLCIFPWEILEMQGQNPGFAEAGVSNCGKACSPVELEVLHPGLHSPRKICQLTQLTLFTYCPLPPPSLTSSSARGCVPVCMRMPAGYLLFFASSALMFQASTGIARVEALTLPDKVVRSLPVRLIHIIITGIMLNHLALSFVVSVDLRAMG